MKEDRGDYRSDKEKQNFISNIEVKLAEKKATFSYVKGKINLARESGRIHASDQLLKAERQAEFCVADLRRQLDQLENTDDDSWEAQCFKVEMAWDDLSQSISKIVARFP